MQYNKVLNNLGELRLNNMANSLSEVMDLNLSTLESLYKLTQIELAKKAETARNFKIRNAHFPFVRTLEEFDFSFQESINKEEFTTLATNKYILEHKNILLLGSCGVGKTHLAISLGMSAINEGFKVLFISCLELINTLLVSHNNGVLPKKLRELASVDLLIIDEIGYLPVEKAGANLLFQLVAKRYETRSTIITSNKPFSQWGETFSSPTIASAIIDRLAHHSYIYNIKGKSYRLKNLLPD